MTIKLNDYARFDKRSAHAMLWGYGDGREIPYIDWSTHTYSKNPMPPLRWLSYRLHYPFHRGLHQIHQFIERMKANPERLTDCKEQLAMVRTRLLTGDHAQLIWQTTSLLTGAILILQVMRWLH